MPYENGRIYVDRTTTPPTGISLSELRSCFGVAAADLGQIISKAIAQKKVNVWAKFKFCNTISFKPLTETQRRIAGYGTTFTPIDANTTSQSELSAILSNAMVGNTGWGVQTPVAVPGQFRAQDWDGYNQNATNPFLLENVSTSDKLKIKVGQMPESILAEGSLKLTDVTEFIGMDNPANTGYGIIYKKPNNVIVHIEHFDGKNLLYPIADSAGNPIEYTIELDSNVAGEYQVCVYMGDINRAWYALLPVVGIKATISVAQAKVELSGILDWGLSKPTFTFSVKNISTSTIAAGTAYLELMQDNGTQKEIFEISIDAISPGGTFSDELKIEDSEIEFSYWNFSYAGVVIQGDPINK